MREKGEAAKDEVAEAELGTGGLSAEKFWAAGRVKARERTLVAEWELRNGASAETHGVAGDEVVGVGHLEAVRAAWEAEFADEALLLDEAHRKGWLPGREALLLLDADAGARSLAEDEDLVKVEGRVAADAAAVHQFTLGWVAAIDVRGRMKHVKGLVNADGTPCMRPGEARRAGQATDERAEHGKGK